MYIETSRPRKEGDQARLLSPFFNVAPKNPYGITNPPAYCFSFYYHMYGKHIGTVRPRPPLLSHHPASFRLAATSVSTTVDQTFVEIKVFTMQCSGSCDRLPARRLWLLSGFSSGSLRVLSGFSGLLAFYFLRLKGI